MRSTIVMVIYIIIASFAIAADSFITIKSLKLKKLAANYLAGACVTTIITQLSYIASCFCQQEFWYSFFISLYYIGITWTLALVFIFFRVYMKTKFTKVDNFSFYFVLAFLLYDTITLIMNPFNNALIEYESNGNMFLSFVSHPHGSFIPHLFFALYLVTSILVNLHRGGMNVPKAYRQPYQFSILTIMGVLFLNGLYIFFPNVLGGMNLDYSIWGFSLANVFVYLSCYSYAKEGMRPFYHSWIVENINQGVALFDYSDSLIIHNDKLEQLFPEVNCSEGISLDEFTKQLNLNLIEEKREYNYSFQFYFKNHGKNKTVRLDHRKLTGKRNELLGQMLVFTDEVGDIDLLTSFYNLNYFKSDLMSIEGSFEGEIPVAVFDINALGNINAEYGRDAGDTAITLLGQTMRKEFPMECTFIRGNEAALIVIASYMSMEEVDKKVEAVKKSLSEDETLKFKIDVQTATNLKKKNDSLEDARNIAYKGLQNKKLMDVNSPKSELVRSIVKALEEVDSDTEEHVKRTQAMGYELGKRLNLTDVELSDLALLCLLHDIGKVAIPLNILNKPGKLSDDEWVVMKSHTNKGYQIARSSKELVNIADMILHHHEKWDGTGYPDGLSKESIPLLSRIISVVDSYDAMVSDRAYRKGMSIDKAISELKRCSGAQFDPNIVTVFVSMLPEVVPEETFNKEETLVMASKVFKKDEPVNYDISRVHPVEYCRYLLDEGMTIVEVNEAFFSLTGYSKEDAVGIMTQGDLIPEEDLAGYMMLVTEQLTKNPMAYFEHRIKCKNGQIKNVLCMGRVYYDSAALAQRSEIVVVEASKTHVVQELVSDVKSKLHVSLGSW